MKKIAGQDQKQPADADWGGDEEHEESAAPAPVTTTAATLPVTSQGVIEQQISEATRERMQAEEVGAEADSHIPSDEISKAVAAVEKRLVPDFKKSFDLLKEIESAPADTRLKKRIKFAVLTRVKRHCFAIQQAAPTLTPQTANQQSSQNRHWLSQPQRRAERLKRLQSEAFQLKVAKPDKNRAAVVPFQRLLGELEVQAAITSYANLWRAYVIAYITCDESGLLSPRERLDRLNKELSGCRDISRIKELRQEIATAAAGINGVSFGNDVQATRAALSDLLTPAKEALVSILEVCSAKLQDYMREAIKTEREFLSEHGFEWQPTPVSQRVEAAIRRVKQMLDGHRSVTVGGDVGIVESAVKSLFGITVD